MISAQASLVVARGPEVGLPSNAPFMGASRVWLTDPRGGALESEAAAEMIRGGGRFWSQDQGHLDCAPHGELPNEFIVTRTLDVTFGEAEHRRHAFIGLGRLAAEDDGAVLRLRSLR